MKNPAVKALPARKKNDAAPGAPALDEAIAASLRVSASIGLLCDLFGELGAARGDGESARLARMLDLMQAEADRVAASLADIESRMASQRLRRSAMAFSSSASSSESVRSKMTSATLSAGV